MDESSKGKRKKRSNPPPALPIWAIAVTTLFFVDNVHLARPLGVVFGGV